jgi:hypothetical protein
MARGRGTSRGGDARESFPRYRGLDVGARYGIYVALIAGIVEVSAVVAELRASGTSRRRLRARRAAEVPPAPEE